MHGTLLVVSDRLINGSLKFYSRIVPPFAKGGQLLKRSEKSCDLVINSAIVPRSIREAYTVHH